MATIEADVVGTKEAARICGYSDKRPQRFLKAVNDGLIPGAKIGRDWRFIVSDLYDFIRGQYSTNEDKLRRKSKTWQLAKRKTVLTTIQDSRSAASECKNLLAQLRVERQKSMRKSAVAR